MITIKIIALLVRIANRKEVPKKIKYQGSIFTYNKDEKDYETWFEDNSGLTLFNLVYITQILNDEVEIIEDTPKEDIPKEDKKIERFYFSVYQMERLGGYNVITPLETKINEIIDKINKGEE